MKKIIAAMITLVLVLGACAGQAQAENMPTELVPMQATTTQVPEDLRDHFENLLGVWKGYYQNWLGDEVRTLQLLVYRRDFGVGARIAMEGEIENAWVTVTLAENNDFFHLYDTERFVLTTYVRQPPGWHGEVFIYLARNGNELVSRGLSGLERIELTRAESSDISLSVIHEHIERDGRCIFCAMPMPHPAPPALEEAVVLRFYYEPYPDLRRLPNDYAALLYREYTVLGEDWLQDAIAQMGAVRDIWYDGRRLYADLLPSGQNHLQGSSNTAAETLFVSLASFPNVDEIVVLVGGMRGFSTDHGSFAGVAVLTGHENPQYSMEWPWNDNRPGVLAWVCHLSDE